MITNSVVPIPKDAAASAKSGKESSCMAMQIRDWHAVARLCTLTLPCGRRTQSEVSIGQAIRVFDGRRSAGGRVAVGGLTHLHRRSKRIAEDAREGAGS